MIKTRDFLGAKTKMKSLISIVNEYDYEDISKAIYCVCVCVNNRSVLESTLSLNWALAEHSHKGNKKIENYDDFKSFFRSIESIIKPSDYDDAYVEDYGEVFIEVFGKKYSVIVGTGHNMVFACLQFLPILACELNKKDELIKVMTYNSFIIDFLKESNIKDGKYGARLVLPSEALFIKVSELFDNLDINTLKSVDNILKSDYIEKKHFIETERGITPLANTSLLMDLYDLINVGFDTENEYVVDYYCKKLKDFPLGRGDYILDNPFSWKITPKENGFYEYVQKGKAGFGGLYRIFQNNCYFFFPHNVKFYPDINEYLKYKDAIFMIEDLIQRMMISVKDIIESCSELDGCAVQVMMMPESYARKSDPSGRLLAQERSYVKSDSIISNRKICIRFVPIVDKLFEDNIRVRERENTGY